jgi:Tfp pilus assembly protein FimT
MRQAKGVSLIEVLVSVALGVIIITLVSFVSFDYLKSSQYIKENDALIALLQKTRSRAINNINGVKHGLHIDTSAHTFIIFQGSTYVAGAATNEVYTYDNSVKLFSDISCGLAFEITTSFDVSFAQLTGNTTPLTIYMGDGKRCGIIDINAEGRIQW